MNVNLVVYFLLPLLSICTVPHTSICLARSRDKHVRSELLFTSPTIYSYQKGTNKGLD